jgi:hypothetical protein
MLQPKLISAEAQPHHALLLKYETGEEKRFDVSPYIKGSWFGRLADNAYFAQVQVIRSGNGIEWPDGQDIAPHELYELSTVV